MRMFEVGYERRSVGGRQGILRIAGGLWIGEECVFEFACAATGLHGIVRCDWRRPVPRLVVEGGVASGADQQSLGQQLAQLLAPFHSGAFADVSEQQLADFYAGDYHKAHHLSTNAATETRHKQTYAELIARLCAGEKVLDAGCSAGELVRQLRARGVDAHGFDLCRDLDAIAYPEVRAVVRQGSACAIPFGPEDGFDALIALDLFEHIPEHWVPRMVAEFARLGVRRILAHVALCEFQYPGHLTLRPLSWWDRQLAPHFARARDGSAAQAIVAGCGGDPSRFLTVWDLARVPAVV